jgi:hypothetical protein
VTSLHYFNTAADASGMLKLNGIINKLEHMFGRLAILRKKNLLTPSKRMLCMMPAGHC